jgi:hypothetical protein
MMLLMPRDVTRVTTGTLKARKTSLRLAMDLLYPRLRLRLRRPPQKQPQAQRPPSRDVSYLPSLIIVPSVNNVCTALAAIAILGAILGLLTLFSRMDLFQ